MSCTRFCRVPSPAQAHCGACHRTFGGVSGFDRHRVEGRCVDPAGLGMSLLAGDLWRVPMSESDRRRLEKTWSAP